MHLLDDEKMSRFLADGFLVLEPAELPGAYHREMFQAASDLYDEGRHFEGFAVHLHVFGDNVVARIPRIREMITCPTVAGALTSILGEHYVLHPHNYVHASSRRDQGFHQDGNLPWNERGHYRSHRPLMAMLFYYPQEVTLDNGPTEVVPGTQYWTRDFEHGDRWHAADPIDRGFDADAGADPDLERRDRRLRASVDSLGVESLQPRRLPLSAGSVVLAHYDLIHRGTRQHPDFKGRRYLYKFYFASTREPTRPAWRNRAPRPDTAGVRPAIRPIVERNWAWMRGAPVTPPAANGVDPQALVDASTEADRMEAAYLLGARAASDDDALDTLARGLTHERESVRRASGYGLGVAGARALETLYKAAGHDDPRTRRVATFAIGETRTTDRRAASVLADRLHDPDDFVRSNAAFALGSLARRDTLPDAVVDTLLERLDPGVESDNTHMLELHRSTVRENICYALLQLTANGRLSDDRLLRFAERGLGDHDRYVRGLTTKALGQAAADAAPAWTRLLLAALDQDRFDAYPGATAPPPKDSAAATGGGV